MNYQQRILQYKMMVELWWTLIRSQKKFIAQRVSKHGALPFIFFYPSNRGLIFYDIDFFISFIIRLIIKVIPIFQTDVRLDVNDRKK